MTSLLSMLGMTVVVCTIVCFVVEYLRYRFPKFRNIWIPKLHQDFYRSQINSMYANFGVVKTEKMLKRDAIRTGVMSSIALIAVVAFAFSWMYFMLSVYGIELRSTSND